MPNMKITGVDLIGAVFIVFAFVITRDYLNYLGDVNGTDIYLISVYHSFLIGLLFKFVVYPFAEKFQGRVSDSTRDDSDI